MCDICSYPMILAWLKYMVVGLALRWNPVSPFILVEWFLGGVLLLPDRFPASLEQDPQSLRRFQLMTNLSYCCFSSWEKNVFSIVHKTSILMIFDEQPILHILTFDMSEFNQGELSSLCLSAFIIQFLLVNPLFSLLASK